MTGSVVEAGRVAVVTGAAMGIGLAAAKRFAAAGMRVCMADIDLDELNLAMEQVTDLAPAGNDAVMGAEINVGRAQDLEALCGAVYETFGAAHLLMNNAATRVAGGTSRGAGGLAPDDGRQFLGRRLWGPGLPVAHAGPGDAEAAIVNTGSKQGITNPPGNVIYNVTKSAVKTYTEQLQHQLRNTKGCQVSRPSSHSRLHDDRQARAQARRLAARAGDRAPHILTGAGRLLHSCARTTRSRPRWITSASCWSAGDITENRPPLSRWHPDYGDAFDKS